MMSHKTETALRIGHGLLAIILGLLSIVVFIVFPSETWVRVVGQVGAYPVLFLGLLVLSGRGPGGRLMLSGKGPSRRFKLTQRPWKYAVVTGFVALAIIVAAVSAFDLLANPALALFPWLLAVFLANLLEPLRKKT